MERSGLFMTELQRHLSPEAAKRFAEENKQVYAYYSKLYGWWKPELERHLQVINDTDWKASDKAEISKEITKIIQRDGFVNPDYLTPAYKWNWCAARLRDGLFKDWDGFEFRSDWAVSFRGIDGTKSKVPKWDGQPVDHIVVLGEQGLGDEILFLSALPELIVRLGTKAVELQCYPRLKSIVERSFKIKVTDRKKLSEVTEGDAMVALSDLFPFYRRDVSHFPRKPYLKPDPIKVEYWTEWLKQFGDKEKIGIAWYSRHGWVNPADLVTSKDAVYFDLQYDYEGKQSFGEKVPFDTKTDLENLFAFVAALDRVVTVTQTLAHVCGSQGKVCDAIIPPKNGEVSWFNWYNSCHVLGNSETWPHLLYSSVTVYGTPESFKKHTSKV